MMRIRTIYAAFLLNLSVSSIDALNFYNVGNGYASLYAEYDTRDWNILKDKEASLEFYFKTNEEKGVLLELFTYDQNTDQQKIVMHIELYEGVLKSCFGNVCTLDDNRASLLGSKWNDMEWHRVQVTRRYSELFINIDGLEAIVAAEDEELDVSNQPLTFHMGKTEKVVWTEIDGDAGFTGCIENVSYPIGTIRSHSKVSEGVGKDCLDSTCFREQKPCSVADGKCNVCTSKSFFTPNHRDSSKPAAYLDEATVIRDKIGRPFSNSPKNTIELHFRTRKPRGILLYNRKSSSYILLELVNGRVQLKFSIGADEVQITAGDSLQDGKWHSVTIKRSGKKVVLDIDTRYRVAKEFLYYPATSTCVFTSELLYLGGYTYPNHVKESTSKRNFDGCLQAVYIYNDVSRGKQEYEYIGRANWSLTLGKDSERTSVDGKLSSCLIKEVNEVRSYRPEVSTKQHETVRSSNATVSKSKRGRSRSKLSENTVAWITAGICIGSVAMVVTLGCGFHFMRKKYSGHFSTKKVDRKIAQKYINSSIPLNDGKNFNDNLMGPAVV